MPCIDGLRNLPVSLGFRPEICNLVCVTRFIGGGGFVSIHQASLVAPLVTLGKEAEREVSAHVPCLDL